MLGQTHGRKTHTDPTLHTTRAAAITGNQQCHLTMIFIGQCEAVNEGAGVGRWRGSPRRRTVFLLRDAAQRTVHAQRLTSQTTLLQRRHKVHCTPHIRCRFSYDLLSLSSRCFGSNYSQCMKAHTHTHPRLTALFPGLPG